MIYDAGPGGPEEPTPRDRASFLIWLALGMCWIGLVLVCIATRGVYR